MEVFAHRGLLNYGENIIMGIIVALQKLKKVEFDVFFFRDSWVLSHDLKSIHTHTEPFKNLMSVLKTCPELKGSLIVDIKWDRNYNKYHKFQRALDALVRDIPVSIISSFDWYFQVSYPDLTTPLIESSLRGKKGLIFEGSTPGIHPKLDYFMIDVFAFSRRDLEDIKNIYPNKILMGYTLPSLLCVPHFVSIEALSVLVVDVRLEDLKFSPLKIKHAVA